MISRRRVQRPLAAAVVLGLVLISSACGGDDSEAEPRTLPSSSSAPVSSSATASPSPDPAAEIEAAVRFYFDVVEEAAATGDTRRLRGSMLPGCACKSLPEFIEGEWARGRITGGAITVTDIDVRQVTAASARVSVTWREAASQTVSTDGDVLDEFRPASAVDDMHLTRRAGAWVVAQVVNLRRS